MVISHMLWGYLMGSLASMGTRARPNVPLLLLLGGVPDFDLYIRQGYGTLLGHHGISHSWLVITLTFIPALAWNWRAIFPLFVATIQHPLFGDLIVNEIPLYYPYSLQQVGFNLYRASSTLSLAVEATGLLLVLGIRPVREALYHLRTPSAWNLTLLSALPLLAYAEKLSLDYLGTDLGAYAGYGLIVNSLGIILILFSTSAYIISRISAACGGLWLRRGGSVPQKAGPPRGRAEGGTTSSQSLAMTGPSGP